MIALLNASLLPAKEVKLHTVIKIKSIVTLMALLIQIHGISS